MKKVFWSYCFVVCGVLATLGRATTWTQITGPTGGNIQSVVLSPNFASDGTVLASTYSQLFKSTDSGANWTFIPMAGNAPRTLIMSPDFSTDQTVYGSQDYPSSSCDSFLKSSDGGSTWSPVALPAGLVPNYCCFSAALAPGFSANQTLFLADGSTSGQTTCYRSVNAGISWTSMTVSAGSFGSLAVSTGYGTDQSVFMTTGGALSKLLRSSDGGSTWTVVNAAMPGTGYLAVSPNFLADQTLFVTNYMAVYRSTNGGTSWTNLSATLPASLIGIYGLVFSPDYAVDQQVFVYNNYSDGGICRWNGTTWATCNTGLSSLNIGKLALSPSFASDRVIVAGSKKGIQISSSVSPSFSTSNVGMHGVSSELVLPPTYSAASPTAFLCSSEEGIFRTSNGGATWSLLTPTAGDYLLCSPNFAVDNILYYTGGNYPNYKTMASANGGTSWFVLTPTSIPYLSISPNYAADQTLFGWQSGSWPATSVVRTTNQGLSWSAVTTTAANGMDGIYISPAYATDATVYAAYYTSTQVIVIKSSNGGGAWTTVSATAGLSNILFSPNYAVDKTMFMVEPDNANGIAYNYKSTDSGATWSLYGGAPEAYFIVSAFSPGYATDQTLFGIGGSSSCGATTARNYLSTDDGVCWSLLSSVAPANYASKTFIQRSGLSPGFPSDHTVWVSDTYYDSIYFVSTDVAGSCGVPTASPTRTLTMTSTPSPSPTLTMTGSATSTRTVTPSFSSTATATPTASSSPSPSATGSPTATGTGTATSTATLSPTPSLSFSASPSWTCSPTLTATPSLSPSFTLSPTFTESPTATLSPTASPSPVATAIAVLEEAKALFVNNPWSVGSAVLAIGLAAHEDRIECKVYSSGNACVWSKTFEPAGGLDRGWTRQVLEGLTLPNGLYYVTVQTSRGVTRTKLMVLH